MSVSLCGSSRRWLARLAVTIAVATTIATTGALPGIDSARANAATSSGQITGIGGNCLTDQGGVNSNGNPIVLDPCGQAGQGWTVPGDGTLRMFNNSMCIGVPYGSTSPGMALTLWSCDGTGSQQWEPGPSGSLVNPHSGLCLDDSAADTTPGNPIQTYTCNGTGAQSWSPPADQPLTVAGIGARTATSGVATGVMPSVSGGYQPYQWMATGLPPGMSINYVDGTVIGAPTATGTYSTTLTVIDERGHSAHATFTWTVNDPATGTSWYLNCAAVNDGNGTAASPWNNVTSASGHIFQPGDRLLVRRGTKCSSSQPQKLALQGNGTATAPIIVEPDPGTSGAAPEIDGKGVTGSAQGPMGYSYGGGAIQLVNQSYWIIQGLTVTNTASTEAQRSGISVLVTDKKEHDGITIRNNNIHDVTGYSDHTDDQLFYHSNAISADLPDADGFIKGLAITGNDLHQIHGGGISLDGAEDTGNGTDNNQPVHNKQVYIAGNNLFQVSNNGIVVCVSDSPLVEHNTADTLAWTPVNIYYVAGIWSWGSYNPTFQYNEVSHLAQSGDSEAWDCDGFITGTCTYQYNYDHDNSGGILLNCVGCESTPTTIVFRHNVSVNDCRIDNRGGTAAFLFTNNTVDCRSTPWNFRYPDGVMAMVDNIFLGPAGSSMPSGPNYLANTYVGSAPPSSDPQASTADPKLVSPGSTTPLTLGGVGGYQLRAGSPALGTGAALTPADRGSDLWGNPVGATANRGAYAAAGTGTPVQFDDAAATYTGSWLNASCSGCVGGHDHYTTVAGSSVQFKATGSTVTIDLAFTRRTGIAAISIDGAPPVYVDTYNPGPDAYVPFYTSPRLTNTTHTVTITCTALKDPASTQTSIGFDGWSTSS